MATIDRNTPMGAARYVRRERYVWPGGYALALVMRDGGLLCADCVKSGYSLIASAHRDHVRHGGCTGWEPLSLTHAGEMEETEHCAHCEGIIHDED